MAEVVSNEFTYDVPAPSLDQYISDWKDSYSKAQWFFLGDERKNSERAQVTANWQADYNSWLSDKEAAYNLWLQDRQNEYNTPANQMARYVDAGLNPTVLYGQISSGNQSQPVKYSGTAAPSPDLRDNSKTERVNRFLGLLNAGLNFAQTLGQVENSFADVKNKNIQNAILENQLGSVQFVRQMNDYRSVLMDSFMTPIKNENGAVVGYDIPEKYQEFVEDVLFPERVKGQVGRENWSKLNYYNEYIAPLMKDLTQNRSDLAKARVGIEGYNEGMLETIPEDLRGIFSFIMPILKVAFGR